MKTAYPNTKDPVAIRLYSNIPFDNSYKNHCFLSNRFKYNGTKLYSGIDLGNVVKERFINRKDYTLTGNPRYYPKYDMEGEFNFNYTNGLICSVTLELTAEQTNANYLRLRTGNSTAGYDYYYYFVTGINQVNADTYKLSLELDVLMTYQDEFLDGMKDVPVFTARKHSHRYTSDGLRPFCADLKSGDDAFNGVVPSKIIDVKQTTFANAQMKKLEGVYWLYICVDTASSTSLNNLLNKIYYCKGTKYPLHMLCLPMGWVGQIIYEKSGGTYTKTYTHTNMEGVIRHLINDGAVHGAKISPYPPFNIGSVSPSASITRTGSTLQISASSVTELDENGDKAYEMQIGNNKLIYCQLSVLGHPFTLEELMSMGCLLIENQADCEYYYEGIDLDVDNASAPAITSNRYTDPKLLFKPFRKYILNAQYSSQGCEVYPELIYSEEYTNASPLDAKLDLITTATGYIGDNNIYTYVYVDGYNVLENYKYEKIGLASNNNYAIPCGQNALDEFNSTQKASFYQSKTASGITSGLTMAGGIGSIVLGAMGLAGSGVTAGISGVAGAGLIAGGVSAFASGTASMVNTIKSADAKIEDLKNTPDSINISGSNFAFDNALLNTTKGLPYLVVYDVNNVIKENADDFFYNYGYQVARECYFNTELKVSLVSKFIDNNLFGRTIFNYVQTNDDITNKINNNIPIIIKQKLNSIFNNGITLWSFFGFNEMWAVTPSTPTSTYYLDRWFMKCQLDNTEYNP